MQALLSAQAGTEFDFPLLLACIRAMVIPPVM